MNGSSDVSGMFLLLVSWCDVETVAEVETIELLSLLKPFFYFALISFGCKLAWISNFIYTFVFHFLKLLYF